MTSKDIPTPQVDPIGIVRYPGDYSAPPRTYPPWLRVMAAMLLVIFATVVVVSTGISIGTYCLTSDGADFTALRPWLDALAPKSAP